MEAGVEMEMEEEMEEGAVTFNATDWLTGGVFGLTAWAVIQPTTLASIWTMPVFFQLVVVVAVLMIYAMVVAIMWGMRRIWEEIGGHPTMPKLLIVALVFGFGLGLVGRVL
jgi:hypothetical protein